MRSRLRDHIGGDVPRFFRREPGVQIIDPVGHIGMDEIRGRDEPRHAGAVIEALLSPERRKGVADIRARNGVAHADAVDIVAVLAIALIDWKAPRGIGGAGKFGHRPRAEPRKLLALCNALREKLYVSDEGAHFGRAGRQGTPVHAARHAGIDAVGERNLRARTRAIGGKIFRKPEDRQAEFLHAGVEMAVAAGEIIAGIALGLVEDVGADMGVGRDEEIAPAPHELAMRVIGQRADIGNRPELRTRRAEFLRPRRGDERCGEHHAGEKGRAHEINPP